MYRAGRFVWPLLLIAVGVLFLLDTLSGGAFDAGSFIGRWWPLLLVAAGAAILVDVAWRPGARRDVPVSVDLAGAQAADVRIDFGAGRLAVGPAGPGKLVEGVLGGGGRVDSDGRGRARLRADGEWWGGWGPGWAGFEWRVGLTREVPLSLHVHTGASDTLLDLGEMRVVDLDVHSGASETRVALPAAAGSTTVRVEAGAASVRLRVPSGVAARISGQMALGGVTVDERRFPRAGFGWASPDWATASNRVEITYRGGVGGVVVE